MTSAKNILLVEADHMIEGWLCQILRAEAFNVSVARSLPEASMRLAAKPGFTAVICDYFLPDGTCLELLAGLRCRPGTPVPVLLTSGSCIPPWPGDVGLELLARPFNAARLLASLNRLVEVQPTDGSVIFAHSPPAARPDAG